MEYSYDEELDCNLEEKEIFDEKLKEYLEDVLTNFNMEEEIDNEQ